MRVLGIDYGGRRIGLALSDELGIAAHGLPTLQNTSEAEVVEALRVIIAERKAEEVVLGLPRNMDGSLGPQAQKVLRFAEALKPLGLPAHFVDERLTTEHARRSMTEAGLSWQKQRPRLDRAAAQIILQIYLDSAKRGQREES